MEQNKNNIKDYDNNDIFWKNFSKIQNNPYLVGDLNDFKCLFVFPTPSDDFSKDYYPTPLGTMASLVRMNKGHAKIITPDVKNYNPLDFAGYDLICFYPMIASFSQTMDLPQKIKKDFSNSKICLFNSDQHQHEMMLCAPKAKNLAEKIMQKYSSLDYILVGESEKSFINLCKKIKLKENDLETIPSCIYRTEGKIKVSNQPIIPVEFKFLPFPSRDYLEEKISPEGINSLSPRIHSSRGCTSQCSFCAESAANITLDGRKQPVLNRDINQFIDEIELLQKNYGAVFFNIMDSSFEDPAKEGIIRMKKFSEGILERKIDASFKIHLRAETIENLDNNFLDLLKLSGVDIIGVGVESALEEELKSYKKRTTVKKSICSMNKLEEQHDFFAIVGYIMFTPELKSEDFLTKVEFLKGINRGWDYMNLSHSMLIFPGSEYHNLLQKRGLEAEHDELAFLIPYNFSEENTRKIADEMSNLKKKCPEVIKLNNALYDAKNLVSRYSNKMNKHLWEKESVFLNFKKNLSEILLVTESKYSSYTHDLFEVIQSSSSDNQKDLIFEKNISPYIPPLLNKTTNLINNVLEDFESFGLSTNKLYLKTWLSLINTQKNIVGGKNV